MGLKLTFENKICLILLDVGLIANGKLNEELTCKTDDGRSKFFFFLFKF